MIINIPPKRGPPKDPEPPCFNFSSLSELIFLNSEKITIQKYPSKIVMTNGTRPILLKAGNSGAVGETKGSGTMNR